MRLRPRLLPLARAVISLLKDLAQAGVELLQIADDPLGDLNITLMDDIEPAAQFLVEGPHGGDLPLLRGKPVAQIVALGHEPLNGGRPGQGGVLDGLVGGEILVLGLGRRPSSVVGLVVHHIGS